MVQPNPHTLGAHNTFKFIENSDTKQKRIKEWMPQKKKKKSQKTKNQINNSESSKQKPKQQKLNPLERKTRAVLDPDPTKSIS